MWIANCQNGNVVDISGLAVTVLLESTSCSHRYVVNAINDAHILVIVKMPRNDRGNGIFSKQFMYSLPAAHVIPERLMYPDDNRSRISVGRQIGLQKCELVIKHLGQENVAETRVTP